MAAICAGCTIPRETPATSPRRRTQSASAAAATAVSTCLETAAVGREELQLEEDKSGNRVVVSFYKFADLSEDSKGFQLSLQQFVNSLADVAGFILVAREGINGNVGGPRESVDRIFEFIESDARLASLRRNYTPMVERSNGQDSPTADAGRDEPFRWEGVRVRCKAEIVTMGVPHINPSQGVGTYVGPTEWNDLIADPDTLIVDVRNDYETRLGRFRNALDPCTCSFREFPSWVHQRLGNAASARPEAAAGEGVPEVEWEEEGNGGKREGQLAGGAGGVPAQDRKVAMYCTGGIRCEKATAYVRSLGFNQVYHLEGGILSYLREVPPAQSLWEGECFVFDKRVAVKNGLLPGSYRLCYACKEPVTHADVASELWAEGVSCPRCYDRKSEGERERARARQRQFETWGRVGGPSSGGQKQQSLQSARSQ